MAQEILNKYLIISNHYFTMKGCTDKDAIIDFLVANDLNCKRPKLSFFFHKNLSNMREKFEVSILSQNVGSFTPFTKGINIFGSKMSM